MKTKITKFDIDWKDIKNECRNTVNKPPSDVEPSEEFKWKLLLSEHSPIRLGRIKWNWGNIKSWISVHFSRHWLGWDKWISTQRTDRTGINRDNQPQDVEVSMDVCANLQSLINVSRYRLCYQASKETREYMEDLKKEIHKTEPLVADVMHKNCVYRGGCGEFTPCGYWDSFCKKHQDENLLDIDTRYKLENKDFYKQKDN